LIVKTSAWPSGSVPEGMRIYAVGDIHGRLDLLDRLLDLIQSDSETHGAARKHLVFLGDYIDRGSESRGAVSRLISEPPPGFSRVCLKGNHEAMLLAFLEDPGANANWLHNGGKEALLSYGVDPGIVHDALFLGRAGLAEANAAFRALLPDDHLLFYRGLETCFRSGGYFFAHAGVRPGVALDSQDESDLIWIRGDFLRHPGDFGAVVVHGHTPAHAPEDLHNRIGIDTLAFRTDTLTAVALEGSRRWFIST
jgi:serine/threonine protein phosphatase 1